MKQGNIVKMIPRTLFILFYYFYSVVTEFDYIGNGETAEYAYYMKNASLILEEIITKRKYDKSLAPLFEPMMDNFIESKTRRLDITFGLNFVKLFNMDAEKQILEARLELAMDWRDARLVWDKRKFGNVSSIVTTTESIWIPDTCITNTKKLEVVTGQAPQNVRIFSNGSIHMVTAYFTETACSIDANIFPFDKQNCSLPVLSLTYLAKWISLHYRVNTVSSTLVGNGEWLVLNALPIAAKISENLEIGSFLLMIKRVPNFYVYVIALPCFILTSLSIIGMFWSPNHKKEQLAKLSIGLTSLVSLTVLMEMLADAIPKTQVFPLLGIYVVACVGITSVACVIVVMHFLPNPEKHNKREALKDKKVPSNDWKSRFEPFIQQIKETICQRHFFLQICFQILNVIGFVVFLSFWIE